MECFLEPYLFQPEKVSGMTFVGKEGWWHVFSTIPWQVFPAVENLYFSQGGRGWLVAQEKMVKKENSLRQLASRSKFWVASIPDIITGYNIMDRANACCSIIVPRIHKIKTWEKFTLIGSSLTLRWLWDACTKFMLMWLLQSDIRVLIKLFFTRRCTTSEYTTVV